MSETFSIALKNNLNELERLNLAFEEFTIAQNLHVEEQYQIFMCLEELVTNVISYAWPQGGDHDIYLYITASPDWIEIELMDDGAEFNPTLYPEPDMHKAGTERQIGGMGIHLVRKTMQQMSYDRRDGKNILFLKKKRKGR
jgi:anti-sigma regulatory factor (Ser/Thr protein kinase)